MQNLIDIEHDIENTLKDKYLTFIINDQIYGLEIKYITELINMQPITKMPDIPEYVKGIINLRGRVIPLIDVRLRFNMEPMDYNMKTSIIVVDIMEKSIGLIVDYVKEVITLTDENMVESTMINKKFGNQFVKGFGKIGSDILLLINCEKILTEDELIEVNNIVQ